ncbi:MAG: family 43 glycosylhydrolase [Oscillospiraceae bacterium]|nr:family 43 glycosylhydrolase [Oscillospiraceae bacterium]
MNQQAFNPYLPNWEYVPDAEPYVFGDRVYVFGSHDAFAGKHFCPNDYVLWSAPVDDLSDWKKEGIIYRTSQDPDAKKNSFMQAPDVVQGLDGRYYLYYTLKLTPFMSVAVSDNITGPYEYYGRVRLPNGHVIGSKRKDLFQFDPGLFRDEDGKCWLYSGFSPRRSGLFGIFTRQYKMDGAYVMELGEDMLTVKSGPKFLIPGPDASQGTGFEGHEFYEASSMRKIDGKYYFIYSSILSHELCYAVSDKPDGGFRYGGTVVSIGDVGYQSHEWSLNYLGNTHGSLVKIKGQWYVFYHRQTNANMFSRQGCAERIAILEDGTIPQVEVTSCGLNSGPLNGKGEYSSHIACNLMGAEGTYVYDQFHKPGWKKHPYFTQTGGDREDHPDQYIANMTDGAVAGFKYFDIQALKRIAVKVGGTGRGVMQVKTSLDGRVLAEIPVSANQFRSWFQSVCSVPDGVHALYFRFCGEGSIDFHAFELV